MSNAHRFAFFCSSLPSSSSESLTITDKELIKRLIHVLRAQKGQEIILFNQEYHLLCIITTITSKSVTVSITKKEKNRTLKPHITVLLPILKRAAFEDALYLVTELGVNEIQLITTDKTITKWQSYDIGRAQRIIIAAAEQSKHFAFPVLHQPISLLAALNTCAKPLLIADIKGKPIRTCLPMLEGQMQLSLLVGPEGDFSQSEYMLLDSITNETIYRCSLIPTILRSEHAIALLIGIVRSML